MGSVCCVAGRPRDLLTNEGGRIGLREPHWQSNVGLSTSTYPHWDVKLQGEDDVTALSSMRLQRTLSSNSGGSRVASSRFSTHQNGNVRNEGSPSDSFRASKWSNSPGHVRNAEDFGSQPDLVSSPSITQTSSKEGGHSAGSSTVSNTPEATPPHLSDSNFSSTRSKSQSSSRRRSIGGNLFFSRRPHHSSGHPLLRQVSDSRIHARNAPNSSPVPLFEGRHSFKLSGSSGDSTVGPHGGASDCWSMQTFSDLVASSRRERLRWTDASSPSDFRWAPGRESMDRATLAAERIRVNSSQAASGPSGGDVQACGICSKLLTQRSPWSAQKMVASNDLCVTAVLVCGHVYHAECLEQVTPEACSLDPSCPVCSASENDVSKGQKLVGQVNVCKNNSKDFSSNCQFSRNKLSRIGVANDDVTTYEGLSNFKSFKSKSCLSINDGMKLPSSSNEKSFLNKSFSKKHFFFRGKSSKTLLSDDSIH